MGSLGRPDGADQARSWAAVRRALRTEGARSVTEVRHRSFAPLRIITGALSTGTAQRRSEPCIRRRDQPARALLLLLPWQKDASRRARDCSPNWRESTASVGFSAASLSGQARPVASRGGLRADDSTRSSPPRSPGSRAHPGLGTGPQDSELWERPSVPRLDFDQPSDVRSATPVWSDLNHALQFVRKVAVMDVLRAQQPTLYTRASRTTHHRIPQHKLMGADALKRVPRCTCWQPSPSAGVRKRNVVVADVASAPLLLAVVIRRPCSRLLPSGVLRELSSGEAMQSRSQSDSRGERRPPAAPGSEVPAERVRE